MSVPGASPQQSPRPGRRRSLPRLGLRAKIIAWTFIPTAIILFVVALATYDAYSRVTEDFAIQRDLEVTRLSAGEISSGFEEYIDRLQYLARQPEIYNGDLTLQRITLERARNRLVFFDAGVVLLDNSGSVTAALPYRPELIGQDWSRRPYFVRMVRSPEAHLSDILPHGPGGVDVIVLAAPILNPREDLRGVALGMFRLDLNAISPFYAAILKQRISRNGSALIIDGAGKVIFASDLSRMGEDFTANPLSVPALAGEVGAQRVRAAGSMDTVASYAPVPRTDWSLVVEENWLELLQPVQGYGQFLLGLLGLGVLVPTLVVMFGVGRITGPVMDFIAAARRIAGGDFDQAIKVHTGDELEELADQFNRMAQQLRQSYASLEQRVAERTAELTAINSVAAVVSRSLDLDQILPAALSKTVEVMGMDAGLVYRLERSTASLHLIAEQGLDQRFRQLASTLSLHSSLVRQAAQDLRPAARLVSEYPPGEIRQALEATHIRMVISIPLAAKQRALGAITVLSRSVETPSAEQMAVAAAVGQQVGVAMENARLYAKTLDYARQMEQARASAEEANASKSAFLASVSHELRTPLTSILGFVRLVQKRLDERLIPAVDLSDPRSARAVTQVQQNLEIVLSEGQRLTKLVTDVLDLEKIEAGKMVWGSAPVQLNAVLEQAVAATAALFEGRGLPLVSEIEADLPTLPGDHDRLVQVVINLLSNAVKFTPQGQVRLHAARRDGGVQVNVHDTGIGIADDDLPRVFEKFLQVGSPLTGKPAGTGLGLSISKEIIEHHGGRIWAESAPGEGSTFSFWLPAGEAA